MVRQTEIATRLGVNPEADAKSEIRNRVRFLVEYFQSIPGCRGFVLGVSGGQDSSLAARLAQLAVTELRQAGHSAEFVAVRLPYGVQHDEADAQLALEFIQPDLTLTVDIKPSVDALADSCAAAERAVVAKGAEATEGAVAADPPATDYAVISDFNRGNIKARIRMVAQYTIASQRSLLVIGTDHAAEAITGFYTKHGDGAADIVPLAGLTKSQGAAMLAELGAPPRLWQKAPTADLLDNQPGQTDEESLGVSYREIDDYLAGETVSEAASSKLTALYLKSEHKRRMPVAPSDDWWRKQ
ncbi:ammonia-dependent NAD(+) synthetase [Leucobacter sp. OH1287]|uniref:ammonia-dependent NAD(+) synthetase n=1 Tax=Leucobacter sp. OH1287 TaxID=2491049 RepID=UPI000F5EE8AE|nr:ammonia-dependent NAD(+) synthetase [Leucobacter sp. OH1287]RRD60224.1 ammonia-dependent NAD(+) synthetase [Leucobacter sp. OH1287]